MCNLNRVYGKKVDVSAEKIKDFYDKRANKYEQGEKTRNTAVLLGDNNPQYADKSNEIEKKLIKPYLNISENHNVLDIGCGVGRWAESIIPTCNEYIGVDFSKEMIKVASKYFQKYTNAKFINSDFQNIFTNNNICDKKFDTVIIAAVSMYINEKELKTCYEKLSKILNKGAIVYIEESVAVKERLTLNNIWSENLNDNYNAIYRTREEYLEILEPLLSRTEIIKEDYMTQWDKKELSETSHWFTLLKKL